MFRNIKWDFELDKVKMLDCLVVDFQDKTLSEVVDDLKCLVCLGYVQETGKQCKNTGCEKILCLDC